MAEKFIATFSVIEFQLMLVPILLLLLGQQKYEILGEHDKNHDKYNLISIRWSLSYRAGKIDRITIDQKHWSIFSGTI